MTIQSFILDTPQGAWSVAEALRSARERFSAKWTARRRFRTVRDELLDYSPQQLAELGIRRADVDFVAGTKAN